MSETKTPFDMFDPTGMVKTMRDASLDAWAKAMTEMVNTDAFAEAQGASLDAWLSSSAPLRKAMENALAQSMAQVNLPSRDDISRLAERLTNIEMRLDDMDAKLDEAISGGAKARAAKTSKKTNEEK
ncbi:MAG: hypothetical protein KDA71_01785 [Planctomycetales bacterium]|nr:hypothetical protein [Planctomycetales bacterium]